ncbi:adenylate/guanylate cyclase with integral membrane sensor [Pelomyxa schiedti]|nr:adenylate/guanylate cyclase with integral membrane sensor [Pelomyxa schiedti]
MRGNNKVQPMSSVSPASALSDASTSNHTMSSASCGSDAEAAMGASSEIMADFLRSRRRGWLPKVSIRTAIMILLEVALVCSLVPVWVMWYTSSNSSIDRVVSSYMDFVSTSTEDFLTDVFKLGERIIEENAQLPCFSHAVCNESNFEKLWDHFLAQAVVPDYKYLLIYAGHESRSFVGAGFYDTYNKTIVMQQFRATNWTRLVIDIGSMAPVALGTILRDGGTGYDCRQRGWYKVAMTTLSLQWSTVYPINDENDLGITVSAPLRCGEDPPCGVVAADFYLQSSLRKLSERTMVGKTGNFWLVEANGDILTTNKDGVALSAEGSDGYATRIKMWDSGDELTRQIGKVLEAQLTNTTTTGHLYSGTTVVGGSKYQLFMDVFNPRPGTGITDFIVVLGIPQSDYFGSVRLMMGKTIGVSAGLVVLFSIIVFILTLMLTSPLKTLRSQMEQAALLEGDFTGTSSAELALYTSPFTEISSIAGSMHKMKRMLQSFRHYVPMQVVSWLVKRAKVAKLGVHRTYCTTMFCDIVDFTAITEEVTPSSLMEVFTDFMDLMCLHIKKHNGTIDKIIGDCIMAFWGSPDPVPNQEAEACQTVLDSQKALKALQVNWVNMNLPVFRARYALCSGPVLAGNSGSNDRFQYTVLGDSVNLASRLEGLNKVFGTTILIDGTVQSRVKNLFVTRKLGTAQVKGKSNSSVVFQLVGDLQSCSSDVVNLCEIFTQAVEHYEAADFARCVETLKEYHERAATCADYSLIVEGEDLWYKQLLSICSQCLADGTPAGWTNVHHFGKV